MGMFSDGSTRRWRAGLCAGLVVVSSAGVCDPGDITIVPEFEGAFSFEGALDGWSPAASAHLVPGLQWSAAVDAAQAVAGGSSLRVTVDDSTATGGVWIERPFLLTEIEGYRIDVEASVGTEQAAPPLWSFVLDAADRPLSERGALPLRGELTPATVAGSVEWTRETHSLQYDTEQGQDTVWVAIGLAAQSAGERTYYLDDVRVVFTRR